MTTTAACESCGMPIETGRYCGYCTDETGALQSFDERFERMTAWQARRNPGDPAGDRAGPPARHREPPLKPPSADAGATRPLM